MTREDVIDTIIEGSLYLYGACGTGKFDIWVVKTMEMWKKYQSPWRTQMKTTCGE